jgi:uncharacterized protein (TIGR00299 family) protein
LRHIHLQPLGGIAGDMFAACLLDAMPQHRDAVVHAAQELAPVECALLPHDDGTLTGHRFLVHTEPVAAHTHNDHHDHHGHDHGAHTQWRDIRARLEASGLQLAVRAHAIGIFAVLAEAEGRVHGKAPDDVTFHEVGAADSIADIVAAAALIDALGPATWSVSSLPIGGGTVRTAHGIMPVPAPATALLLQGFAMHDDGITGERVTPTGAAILRYLGCASTPPPGALRHSGYGFGTRRLGGISNCLRALVFDTAEASPASHHRELAVISFEVDDQSGEDLATGLERVRATPGVHDVIQMPAFGKKSRLAVHVQVLAAPGALDAAVDACFRETTTIGLRTHLVQGRALPRHFATVEIDGHPLTVKLVERPGAAGIPSLTGKVEADHIRPIATHAARAHLRRDAESAALALEAARGPDAVLQEPA